MTDAECLICRKHGGAVELIGGPIFDDAMLFDSHGWETPEGVPDEVSAGEWAAAAPAPMRSRR